MDLSIKISRLCNTLFFIQKSNKVGFIKSGLQKYLLDEKVSLSFYGKSDDKIWKQIEKNVGKEKVKEIQNSIGLLDQKFNIHWHKAYKHLLSWQQYFLENESLFQKVIFEIEKLSGIKSFSISKIPVYLVSDLTSKNKEINAWFSWEPKNSFIVVEIPFNLQIPKDFFPLAVLAHEFFHLMLRKNEDLFLKIKKIAKENNKLLIKLEKNMLGRMFFEELLISSFIPEGYLGEKHFKTKVISFKSKPKNVLEWRKFIAYELYKIAKQYVDNNKQIDEEYLKKVIENIK
ncbi:MAG: hypothetical protein PHG13_02170 [Candidatus Pacebacteria bacterium]|nr:hypothetical protein [Candidatus Paceibacterota bacterium]MDD5721786.1 hypothetical protein [Candidatus Paceibacterota bacterium]